MTMRRRLQRLQDKHGHLLTNIVCGECGEEFTAYGRDVALELLVAGWSQGSGEGYERTREDIRRIIEHEPDALIEKRSGLPLAEATGLGWGRGSRL